jgi:recombinational DNA repair ATPase RecF
LFVLEDIININKVLYDYFKEDIQIFITTTDIKDINDELKAKSDIYVVDNGNFDKEE